jgi:choline-sulfatase
MRPASRASLKWRLLAAPCIGASAGAMAGALEGLIAGSRAGGDVLHAILIEVGLFAPLSVFTAFAAVGLIWLAFGPDPLERWRGIFERFVKEPDTAARFASRSLAFGSALLIFAAIIFHLSQEAMTTFHHMGLAAMLLVAVFTGTGLFLLLVGARLARILERLLGRMPSGSLRVLAALSILECPGVLLVACALSPVDGSGLFGFMGLVKREEIELAFLAWAILPLLGSSLTFLFLSNKLVRWILPASVLGCAVGFGALSVAAFEMDSYPKAALAIEENAGMGKRLLSTLRALTDCDRDGASDLFGGGDCDDGDPARWPGAVDIPVNGIDEDCSGFDATLKSAPQAGLKTTGSSETKRARKDLSLVVLTIDALRWDVGFMGYGRPTTPNMDDLASKSVVFEKAYALSSFTGRSLAPMFIGRYPSETYCDCSHFTEYLPKNDMLAEILKRAGFRTAGVGSHYYFKGYGLEQGFDRFSVEVPEGKENIDQKITSDLVADKAIEILNDESFTSNRFFLWAHFMDPHRDYLRHKGFPEFGDKARDRYDGEVAFADHHAGRVIDKLRDAGLLDRTAIMVTGDHGEAFMEHDIMFHGRRLWEEVVRVPWIWSVPGMDTKRVRARVSHIDLVATVCDLLGVKPPDQSKGRSLAPLMSGEETSDRRVLIEQLPGEYMEEMYALIDQGYKLIHKIIGNRFSLFNLNKDPEEKQDLSAVDKKKLDEMKETYRSIRSGLERNAPRQ